MQHVLSSVTVIIWVFTLTFSVHAQKQSDREIKGLKGTVKSYAEKEGDYENKFGKWVKQPAVPLGHYEFSKEGYRTRYPYAGQESQGYFIETVDRKGNVLTSKLFTPKGKLLLSSKGSVDANGLLSETVDDIGTKTIFTYDSAGLITEENEYFDDGKLMKKTINEYDRSGHIVRSRRYNKDGEVDREILTSYDDRGYESSVETLTDGIRASKHLYQNDTLGRDTISIECVSYGDAPVERNELRYNKQGDLVSLVTYDGTDKVPSSTIKLSYVYDSHGNWIEKSRTKIEEEFGKLTERPFAVNYRTIIYY